MGFAFIERERTGWGWGWRTRVVWETGDMFSTIKEREEKLNIE